MKKYKYILFDLDGTLTDSKDGIINSIMYALDFYGIKEENPNKFVSCIGRSLPDTLGEYFNYDQEKIKEVIIKFREYYMSKGMYENYLYDGIKELIEELTHNSKKVMIATTKFQPVAEQVLEMFKIKEYFTYISGETSDNVKSGKAHIIKRALDENNVADLSEAVMIGDKKYDILGAKENNIDSIGVLYGYGTKEEIKDATYFANTVEELKNLLI